MSLILDYNQYLFDIDNLSKNEDLIIYDKFKKQSKNGHLLLSEGLIKTHPVNSSVNIIKKRFPNLIIEVESDGEIYIEGTFSQLKNYLPLFNNLGYFISIYTINGVDWIKDHDENTIPIAIYLEAKYDIKIEPIPNILYHASPSKYKDNILKIGFIPKTGNKLSNHPDRIYLTDNLNLVHQFGRNIKMEQGGKICIWEIDGKSITNLYSDVNLRNGGFYTLQNISPECFKLLEEY